MTLQNRFCIFEKTDIMGLTTGRKKQVRKRKIPESFIYEILDGKPLYYKGYKAAIRNHQTAESIMGASSLQVFILEYLLRILYKICDESKFRIFSGEPGLHVNHKNNLAGDILVYDKKTLPASKISNHYADVPAELQIEVDIQAELEDMTETGYIKRKTDILLEFGTKKVIWIFTFTQQVMVAEKDKDRLWIDWNKSIQLWKDEAFCIGEYLKKEGVKLEEK
jgi:Uma2 family endonuclease